jgi:hypothetical protein
MCVRVLCGFASRGDLLTPLRTPQAVDSRRSGSLGVTAAGAGGPSLPRKERASLWECALGQCHVRHEFSPHPSLAQNEHIRAQTNTTTRSSTATPTRPHSRCSARFWPDCACARGVCVHGESALRLRPRGRNAMIYPRRLRRARVSACA